MKIIDYSERKLVELKNKNAGRVNNIQNINKLFANSCRALYNHYIMYQKSFFVQQKDMQFTDTCYQLFWLTPKVKI